MDIFLLIFVVLFIVILSGLISGSEAAILSISLAKAKELSNGNNSERTKLKAVKLIRIKENIQKYITTIVVLNNVVNIIGSIYVGIMAVNILGEVYLGIFSAIITFLIIIFSEIIPKIYGERYNEFISLNIATILILTTNLLKPINYLLNLIISIFVRENIRIPISEGEIREMAVIGKEDGSINSYESNMIENVFKMDEIEAYDIMIPKNKVVSINYDATYNQVLTIALETGYTRFPVSNKDEIIGVINVKDLFKFHSDEKNFSISKILRLVIFIPESMKIYTLEKKLKKDKIHLAIVVNEHGDFTGIVTLEDIIEELVGEIEDEFDEKRLPKIEKVSEKKYKIDGDCHIDVLNEKFKINLEKSDEYNTINGFLIDKIGDIPQINDRFDFYNGSIRVIKRTKKKVLKVELKLN
jgi:putative hemolysin